MESPQVRAIVGARVSHMQGAEKTSHLTQHETGGKYAGVQGWEVVGSFEDLDVSALKTTPWERPDLRPWLTDRVHEWDALIVAKVDRLFRSAGDCIDLARWAEKHRKILVIVDDGLRLDFYRPVGEQELFSQAMTQVFLILASVFAEIEGKRYVQRANDRVRHLRTTDRWGWGAPPYGYVIIEHPSGKGKALALDPEMQAVLHRAAGELLSGSSLTAIVTGLTGRGVLSPRGERRTRRGDPDPESGPEGWSVRALRRCLASPATQGLKMVSGKVALDPEGQPIRVGPPSFDPAEWDLLQRCLAERSANPRERRHTSNPMLGVGYCKCGASLTQQLRRDEGVRRYRCGRTPRRCSEWSVVADDAEALVEHEFLEGCGDLTVVRRVFVPGEDSSYDLAEVNETIEGLRRDRAAGLFRSPADEATFQSQMAALLARRDDLESRPTRAAGYDYVPTGRTYREQWVGEDTEGRRRLLIDAGVRYTLIGRYEAAVNVPPDMQAHMRRSSSRQPAADGLPVVTGRGVPGYIPDVPTDV